MKFLKRVTRIAVIILIYGIFLLVSLRQSAHSQVIDSAFYRWTVYEMQENELDDKKCYIVAYPLKSDSNHNSRKNPYIMITRFQKDRTEEVSVFGGYEYKLSSQVVLMIDYAQYRLKAKKDLAWAPSKQDDVKIINALLQSAVVKVRSDSAIGTYAIDEYSLQGITRAYGRMREVCK